MIGICKRSNHTIELIAIRPERSIITIRQVYQIRRLQETRTFDDIWEEVLPVAMLLL